MCLSGEVSNFKAQLLLNGYTSAKVHVVFSIFIDDGGRGGGTGLIKLRGEKML